MNEKAKMECGVPLREEEERLYLQGGLFRYGLKPVPGTALDSLDQRHSEQNHSRHVGPQRHRAGPDRRGVPLHGSTMEGTEGFVIPCECKCFAEVVGFHQRLRCLVVSRTNLSDTV